MTDNKQEAWLKSAKIDFKAGTLSSSEPVKVSMPGTTIEADAVDITEQGKVISFIGRVKTVMQNGAALPTDTRTPGAVAAPARTSQAEPMSLRQ